MDELYTMIIDEDGQCVYVGGSSVIGSRSDQQDTIMSDTYYNYIENGGMISILCDGMGGLSGGKTASSTCAEILFRMYHAADRPADITEFFMDAIVKADSEVKALRDEDGNLLQAGTTLAAVSIEDNKLYWASVGDSRIYVIRGKEIMQITKDHNYMMLLNEHVLAGEITREEADSHPKREALVSYIGIGGVRYISRNNKPLELVDGDFIVLCSDGLYRSITTDEMMETVVHFGTDTQTAAETLTNIALSKNNPHQDNTSVIVLNYVNGKR